MSMKPVMDPTRGSSLIGTVSVLLLPPKASFENRVIELSVCLSYVYGTEGVFGTSM